MLACEFCWDCVWWFILLISYTTVKSACVIAIFGKSLCQGQCHSFRSHNIGSPVKASLHINSHNSSVILCLSVQLYIFWLAQITICQRISVLVFVYYRQLCRLSVESILFAGATPPYSLDGREFIVCLICFHIHLTYKVHSFYSGFFSENWCI